MGKLIIKNINKENIDIIENYHTYKIMYKLPYVKLSGITLNLYDIHIKELIKDYKIIIKNEVTIQLLLDIDNLFSSKINNYTPLLKMSHNEYYITLKRNNTVDHIMQEYKNSLQLPINIFFIKKCASHCYPIVYIL